MSDFTVKELSDILKKLPQDARVHQSSGEKGGIIFIVSKNGNKYWNILKSGEVK